MQRVRSTPVGGASRISCVALLVRGTGGFKIEAPDQKLESTRLLLTGSTQSGEEMSADKPSLV